MLNTVWLKHAVIQLNSLSSFNPGSPRSKQACQRLGILEEDLVQKTLQDFQERGVPDYIAQMRYEHHKKNIQEDIQRIIRYKLKHFRPQEERRISIAKQRIVQQVTSPIQPVNDLENLGDFEAFPQSTVEWKVLSQQFQNQIQHLKSVKKQMAENIVNMAIKTQRQKPKMISLDNLKDKSQSLQHLVESNQKMQLSKIQQVEELLQQQKKVKRLKHKGDNACRKIEKIA